MILSYIFLSSSWRSAFLVVIFLSFSGFVCDVICWVCCSSSSTIIRTILQSFRYDPFYRVVVAWRLLFPWLSFILGICSLRFGMKRFQITYSLFAYSCFFVFNVLLVPVFRCLSCVYCAFIMALSYDVCFWN